MRIAALILIPSLLLADVPSPVLITENSTVLLHMKMWNVEKQQSGWGSCSGTYVDDNTILTAAHCVSDKGSLAVIEIWVKDYSGHTAKALPYRVFKERDLALLHTELIGKPAKMATSVHQGQSCYVLGNPLDIERTITAGVVSKTDFKIKNRPATYIITDAVILPGNSGGALVDSKGHLLGVVVMTTSMSSWLGASGLGLVVSLKDVKSFLEGR